MIDSNSSSPATNRGEPASPPDDLFLAAQSLVEGLGAGRHLARRTGDADEFYDFKPYAPGDPVSRIDWRIVARRDSLYLRRRRHEAPLHVALIVDASASMGFRSLSQAPWPTKLQSARRLAAALALIALRQGDRVTLVAAGNGEQTTAPVTGAPSLHELLEPLARLTPGGVGGASAGLNLAINAAPAADIFIALTDALEPPESLAEAVSQATARSRSPREIMLIQTLSEDELRPAPVGATLVDPESEARTAIGGAAASERAATLVARHIDAVRAVLLRARGRYELHRTSESGASTLRRLLMTPR